MKVEYSPEAEADLDAIADYLIEEAGERIAESMISRLLSACEQLGSGPKAFPAISTLAHLNLRRRVVRNFLVFYRVTEIVQIVRVIHGARDYSPLLGDD